MTNAPREGLEIGDGELIANEVVVILQTGFEDGVKTTRFGCVATNTVFPPA